MRSFFLVFSVRRDNSDNISLQPSFAHKVCVGINGLGSDAMIKNALILCLSLIFSVSISAADLYADQEIKPSQVTVEMASMTCEDADRATRMN